MDTRSGGARWMAGTVACVLAVICIGAEQTPPQDVKRVECTIRNVLWQPLPDEVRAVYVGPDKRLWLEVGYRYGDGDVAAARKLLEREFRQPMPQLWGLRPVLFEPDGQVWFAVHFAQTLLGYDGREVIERHTDEQLGFVGNCPGHGASGRPTYNLQFGNMRFFPDRRGIHTFDGKSWGYQPLFVEKPEYSDFITLVPAVDGKGAFALAARQKSSAVWEWRNGKWAQVWAGTVAVAQIAPYGTGILMRTWDGQLLRHPQPPEGENHRFGPYVITSLRYIYTDSTGSTALAADKISQNGQPFGAGLALVDPKQQFKVLAGEEFARDWNPRTAEDSGPLPVGPNKVWVQSRLLDFAAGKTVDALPDTRFKWLHAVQQNGRVFASTREPSQPARPIMVYTPGAPGDGKALEPIVLEAARHGQPETMFAIGSDGAVWTSNLHDELVRFDGKKWTGMTRLPVGRTGWVRLVMGYVIGRAGEVLVHVYDDPRSGINGTVFVAGDTILRDKPLLEMIVENRKLFADAFAVPDHSNRSSDGLSIFTDKGGNIWVKQERKLRVLVGNTWIDAADALTRAGAPRPEVEYVCGLGDGSRVYLNHFRMVPKPGGQAAFFGEIRDGTVVLTPAPQIFDRLACLSVTDRDGAVWLPGFVGEARSTDAQSLSLSFRGQKALRLTEKGVVQEIDDQGEPFLFDQSGNLWLGRVRRSPENRFNVFRDGKVAGTIAVGASDGLPPTGWRLSRFAWFSDKPGSVWSCTATMLQHYVADPQNPASFTRKAEYSLAGIRGQVSKIDFSPLGYVVVAAGFLGGPDDGKYGVYLYRLP
ncbi:MAG: hypothetical protein ACHRHE_21505 [Tepidisphaerales bacterium]